MASPREMRVHHSKVQFYPWTHRIICRLNERAGATAHCTGACVLVALNLSVNESHCLATVN